MYATTLPTIKSYNSQQIARGGIWRGPIGIGITVVVVAAIVAGSYFGMLAYNHARAQSVAQAFIRNLNSGNTAKAYVLTSPAIQKQQTAEKLNESLGDLTTAKPSYKYEQTKAGFSTATYVAVESGLPPTDSGSLDATYTISLVRDGLNNWLVDSVYVN